MDYNEYTRNINTNNIENVAESNWGIIKDFLLHPKYSLKQQTVKYPTFEELLKHKWQLKDEIMIYLFDGETVNFRVEHINPTTGKVYFVATESIGKSCTKYGSLEIFLNKFETRLPIELFNIMKPICHTDKLDIISPARKISLLTLANVCEGLENIDSIETDDILFDGMTTSYSRVRSDKNGEIIQYWIATPRSFSEQPMMIGHDGLVHKSRTNIKDIIPCFAL